MKHRRAYLSLLAITLFACLALSTSAMARPADRDNDRLPDRWEHRYDLPVSKGSALGDPDGDGLRNQMEYRWRVNPRKRDTDRDGTPDGAEVRRGTNPRRATHRRRRSTPRPRKTHPFVAAPRDSVRPTAPGFTRTTYVDRASLGGDCSDVRTPEAAQSPATPWCSFERASAAAPSGSLVLVRAGDYGAVALRSGREANLTFRPYPGERPVLGGGTIRALGIRIEGFLITGTVTLEAGASEVGLVANDWVTDGQSGGTSLNLQAGVRNVLIEGNRIRQQAGVLGANAINFSSTDTRAPIENVTIRGNLIGPIPGGGDAIQAKNTRSLVIESNEIFGVSRPPGSSAHPDAIQTIYGAVDLVLRRNFIHDIAAQGIFVEAYRGQNRNVVAEDNVVAGVAYPWTAFGLSADTAYVRHNTIGGTLRLSGTSLDAYANVATSSITAPADAQFLREDYNLSPRFSRPHGPRSIVGAPAFQDPSRNDFTLRASSLGKAGAPDKSDLGAHGAAFGVR